MPELPEAETIARQLDEGLRGQTLGRVRLTRRDIVHGSPEPLGTWLPRRRVERVWRRAKRVIIELDPPAHLIFRLGMTGRLTLCSSRRTVEKHTHLRIAVRGEGRELRFCDPRRFGGVWCLTGGDDEIEKELGELGPEPLTIKPRLFAQTVGRRRQIKALLLDQHAIAGLGNIYCDEALHRAGIHPLTRADTLGEDATRRLLRAIKTTLRQAIRCNGSTVSDYRRADGQAGSFQKHHRVYGREGSPCRTCHTPIERMLAAGRSTFVCPTCQRGE